MRSFLCLACLLAGCSEPRFQDVVDGGRDHDAGEDAGSSLAEVARDGGSDASRARGLRLEQGGFRSGGAVGVNGALVITQQGFEASGVVCAGALCAHGGLTP